MGSKSSSSTASTTNITTTTENNNALATAQGAVSIVAGDGFQGDIGLTGFDAVQAVQSFNQRAMQQDLLAAQNTANALSVASASGGGSSQIFVPSSNSNQDSDKPKANTNDVQRLALVLGGVAAVATVLTLSRKRG